MVVEGYPNVLITLFTDLIALYNVSATMICSLVYLILLHDGVFVSRFLSAPPKLVLLYEKEKIETYLNAEQFNSSDFIF